MSIVLGALLGWLLGLLTPQIVDYVRRKYERRRMSDAARVEFSGLAARLALSAYYVWSRNGQLTPARYLRVAAATEGDAAAHPRYARLAENLRRQAALPQLEIDALNRHNAQRARGSSAGLRKIEAPYLTALLNRIDVFTDDQQAKIFAVYAQLNLFNDVVGELQANAGRTFENLSDSNYAIVRAKLNTIEMSLGQRADYLLDLISSLQLDGSPVISLPSSGEYDPGLEDAAAYDDYSAGAL